MRSPKRTLLGLVLLALLPAPLVVAAAEAPASSQADEAQFHFLRGNRAYQEKRYEDALASWYTSNRLVANRNVQFNIARCLEKLSRYDEAFRAWSTLLSQPLAEKEQKTASEAIDQLRPHLALLEIKTDPEGAVVYAGRRDLGALGATPKLIALAPGKTAILLERPGYRPTELSAELERGKQISLSATLERIYGTVEIRRVPADAEIRRDFMDGEIVRKGPGGFRVVPGPIVLFVSAPGHLAQRIALTAQPDQNTVADLLLPVATPPSGALVVRSNIPGALIKLDGKEAGFCPAVIENVPTGPRQVEIVEEGRKTFTMQVDIKKDERAFVDARLGKADQEVTAATKSAASAETVPASISVVTADEIAAMGYSTLIQALESVRGTFTSNDRSYEAIGFRGFSPPSDYTNRVLVLVDGHAVNDAVTGQGYVGRDLDVDLSNVARIEVVRGPGSVLYGTGALFGVINVVTKRPTEGTHGSVATTTGSMGLMTGRATLSARSGNAEIMASAAIMDAVNDRRYTWDNNWYSQWLATQPQGTATPVLLNADSERAKHADLLARLGSFSLRAGYNERKKEVPSGAYHTDPLNGTTHFDHRAYADLRFEQSFGGLRVAVRGAYDASWYRGRFQYLIPTPDVSDTESLSAQWVTGELRLELPEFLRQRITLGGEVVDQLQLETDVSATPIPKELIVSAYVVDAVTLHERARLNLGLRSDYYTQSFGMVLTPRFAFIVKPYQSGTTKFMAGRSFRAPSPNERSNTESGSLKAEFILSGEVEHTHVLSDDLRIVGAVFANDLTNLVYIPPESVLNENLEHKIRGIGAESELRWEPGAGMLLGLSTTYQRVIVYQKDGTHPYVNSPRTLVKARGMIPLMGPALRAGAEIFLDSGRHFDQSANLQDDRVDDTIICNLTLSGEYRPYHLRYFGGLYNLFDVRDYRSGYPTSTEYWSPSVPRYGRTLRAGLSVGF